MIIEMMTLVSFLLMFIVVGMATHCDTVQALNISPGAQDTFTAVGTVKLRSKPGIIIGVITNGTANANTAAEAIIPQFKFDLGNLGRKEILVTGMDGIGESVATQSQGHGLRARLTACNIPFQGNENIDISAGWHASGTPTAGLNAQCAVLYSQPPHPPPEFYRAWPGIHPITGSDSESNAAVTANAAIDDLETPSKPRHICGFGCTAAQDAAGRTAEDMVLGINFTSDLDDFTPQEYPFLSKFPNLAGTLVGSGIKLPYVEFPAWIPTNNVAGTITPTTNLVSAMTDAHAVAVDVFYTEA